MKKIMLPFIFVIIFLLASCTVSSKNSVDNTMSYDTGLSTQSYDSDYNNSSEVTSDTLVNNTETDMVSQGLLDGSITGTERKIIDKADLSIETDNFDKALEEINNYIGKYNGYIELSNMTQDGINSNNYKKNRYCEYIIRVPQESFQNVLNDCSNIGVITNKRIYGEDVSSRYYDVEARLKVLNSQEERYLEILDKAQNVEEIIEIEKALTDIRYEIENLTGYIKQMDDLISYSTINLYISEVSEKIKINEEPKTLGEKIVSAFNKSIEALKAFMIGILLFFVAIIPFSLILLITIIIIVFIIKYIKRNKYKNNK